MSVLPTTLFLWAQAQAATAPPAGSGGGGTASTLLLAMRRWCGGLTLMSPDSLPTMYGLQIWLAGLFLLGMLATAFQGPGRVYRQFFDIPGHFRLWKAVSARIRNSGRLLAIAVGVTVVAWTAGQSARYSVPEGKDDLLLAMRGRTLLDLGVEHGAAAAITPIRDVVGLGNIVIILIAITTIVFQHASDRWGSLSRVLSPRANRDSFWGTVAWGSTALYGTYRFISMLNPAAGDIPLGGCVFLEAIAVPTVMLLSDGVVLAWVLVEIRDAGLGESDNDRINVGGGIGLMPATSLACLLVMPSRYLATTLILTFPHLPAPALGSFWGFWPARLRDLLGWRLHELQAASLLALGLLGAVAWSRGTIRSAFAQYARLLRAEGGRLVAVTAFSGLISAGLAGLAYTVILAIPPQPWLLAAADSYAHYATLPIGLCLIAALVELGERSLPTAVLAGTKVAEPDAEPVAVAVAAE